MKRTALATIAITAAALLGFSCPGEEQATGHAVAARPYVVVLVMDEFPSDSLLDRHGRIDPVRYPNFAALAGDATWFRNAYSVYDSTTKAGPLILDGLRPRPGTSADRRDHPHSIYDLFDRYRYRIVDSEEASALCP